VTEPDGLFAEDIPSTDYGFLSKPYSHKTLIEITKVKSTQAIAKD
jgi:hypothetical protein